MFPLLASKLFETSGRWTTCVRHENIDATKSLDTCIDKSLDIFSPPRQDWLNKTDDYLRQK